MYTYIPKHISKYNIYDIFHSDKGNIVLIQPSEKEPNDIKIYIDDEVLKFETETCPHNHTHIYYLNIVTIYRENHSYRLIIDNEEINTTINKYPIFENEIIMSTIVKSEYKYILQWINYHLHLGVQRFIIYDNSYDNTLQTLLNKYINENTVILIQWRYPYMLKISGISGQTTQQNHSIYSFNRCEYIGLFDIDEYINIQEPYSNISTLLDDVVKSNNINKDNIGGFQLLNKFFYNPKHLPDDNYNFLKIYNCNKITMSGNEKNFVIPKNVKTFSVHMITNGLPIMKLTPNIVYFNHYIFLNKTTRGLDETNLSDSSINRLTNLFSII
jgi:hypothetical protein